MIKVSIIEDDGELGSSLQQLINRSEGFNCLSVYGSIEKAVTRIVADNPDVILMDIELAGKINGIEGTKIIKGKLPAVNIIMLTIHEDNESVFQSLKNGAVGYMVKNLSLGKLLEGITEVQNGGAPMSMTIARKIVDSFKINRFDSLTNRENEVLQLLCQGKSYQAIANKLFIEKTTVKYHLRNIYNKLHVCNRSEAIIKAKNSKIV